MGRPHVHTYDNDDSHSRSNLNDNVVMLEARRDEPAPIPLSAAAVFASEPKPDFDIRQLRHGDVVQFDSPLNRSLQLAQQADFLSMCLPILWGDEKRVHYERFGWLLRGAITTFKPLSTFELYLVKNVVAAQWRLDRLQQTQTNVYENEARSGEVGKYGLPKASHAAMELDGLLYAAQKSLSVAINNYLTMVKTAQKALKR